jgi:hypothetical protein
VLPDGDQTVKRWLLGALVTGLLLASGCSAAAARDAVVFGLPDGSGACRLHVESISSYLSCRSARDGGVVYNLRAGSGAWRDRDRGPGRGVGALGKSVPPLLLSFRYADRAGRGLACATLPDGRSPAILCRNRTNLLLLSSNGAALMALGSS